MKSIRQVKPIMNFWQKANIFRRRYIWGIVASIIALFTWLQEKITIEDNRNKISDFFRMENEIGQMLWGNRVFEMQRDQTLANKQTYGNDSIHFQNAFFINVNNLIVNENLCWFYFRVQSDLDADKATASIVNEEKAKKDKEWQDILNTKNFTKIADYDGKRTVDFSAEVIQGQKDTQQYLFDLDAKLKENLNLYFYSYLLAAFLFFIDKIKNVKEEES